MCDVGEPGAEGYIMRRKECVKEIARLSLKNKLSLAKKEMEYPFLIPYYDWNPDATKQEVMHQIVWPPILNLDVLPEERFLSILLKNPAKFGLE